MRDNRQSCLGALLLAAVAALLALWLSTANAGAQSPGLVYLPLVDSGAPPQAMPSVGDYLSSPVNLAVFMGGESPYDWLQASTLLAFWNERDDGRPPDAVVCWYGDWPNGTGGARCDVYPQ